MSGAAASGTFSAPAAFATACAQIPIYPEKSRVCASSARCGSESQYSVSFEKVRTMSTIGAATWSRRSPCSRGLAHSEAALPARSEEHTSELQSRENLVCRLLLEKKNYSTYA